GLGGQGVAQLVGRDVTHPGGFGDPVEDPGDDVAVDPPAVAVEQQPKIVGRFPGRPVCEQLDDLGVERNETVVVELADGDPQPPAVVLADDGVGCEGAELTDPHPGPGEEFDHETAERVLVVGRGPQQPGGGGVVEEPGQRLVGLGKIRRIDGNPRGRVVIVPLDDPLEEGSQDPEPLADGVGRKRCPITSSTSNEGPLEALDVDPADAGDAAHLRVVGGHVSGEGAQDVV